MKISPTGFFCVCALIASSAAAMAQSAPGDDPQNPASQNPTSQNPASQQPQQAPQPTQPPQGAPQQTPTTQAPTTGSLGPNVTAPPELPKYPDVRLPGEYGFYIGLTAWFPTQQPIFNKGRNSGITDDAYVTLLGTPKLADGIETGLALGLHNAIRLSIFESRATGNFTTGVNELTLWSQIYPAGTYLTTDYLIQNAKLSFDFLTWPYPVESRRFRLKTLYQVQYTSVRAGFDAPLIPTTDANGNPLLDSSGNPISYKASSSKWFILPTFGAQASEYLTRNIHIELGGDGFAIPRHSTLYEGEGSISVHFGHFEIRGGGKLFHFKTSTNSQFYMKGTMAAPFIGIRWFSR